MNNDNSETFTVADLELIGFALLMCPKSTLSPEGKHLLAELVDKADRIWATTKENDKVSV